MDKIKELKSEAYDILARIEAYTAEVRKLHEKLNAVTAEIKAEAEKPKDTKAD